MSAEAQRGSSFGMGGAIEDEQGALLCSPARPASMPSVHVGWCAVILLVSRPGRGSVLPQRHVAAVSDEPAASMWGNARLVDRYVSINMHRTLLLCMRGDAADAGGGQSIRASHQQSLVHNSPSPLPGTEENPDHGYEVST